MFAGRFATGVWTLAAFAVFWHGLSNAQTPAGTEIANQAAVSYADTGGAFFGSQSGQVITQVSRQAALQLTLGASRQLVAPGDSVLLTLEVRNLGNAPAVGVTLDALLSGVPAQVLEAAAGGVIAGLRVGWTAPFDLGPGERVQRQLVVPEIPPGTYQLQVFVQEISTGRVISKGAEQQITVRADGSATRPKNAISGQVRGRGEESGRRYAGGLVELLDGQELVVARAVLDEDGRYDFQALPPGGYRVRDPAQSGNSATGWWWGRTPNPETVPMWRRRWRPRRPGRLWRRSRPGPGCGSGRTCSPAAR